jgi:hypothetical protein
LLDNSTIAREIGKRAEDYRSELKSIVKAGRQPEKPHGQVNVRNRKYLSAIFQETATEIFFKVMIDQGDDPQIFSAVNDWLISRLIKWKRLHADNRKRSLQKQGWRKPYIVSLWSMKTAPASGSPQRSTDSLSSSTEDDYPIASGHQRTCLLHRTCR